MKTNYLFSPVFKNIGWVLMVLAVIANLNLFCGWISPSWECDMFSLIPEYTTQDKGGGLSFIVPNWGWEDELAIVLTTLAFLFISFAREKGEDEMISAVRLYCMAFSMKYCAMLLIFFTLFVYGSGYLYIFYASLWMYFIIFIAKFYYELSKMKGSADEE